LNVIGICGLIGSGKGTVADILVNTFGYTKISFADKVKDGVATVFGWDRSLLEGDTPESREWREQPDKFWTNETGQEITPRVVLQRFGTDCMRNGFYDGVWVSLVKKKILENPDKKFVIPDARFANELGLITELSGEIWWVRRGDLPEWWNTAIATNQCTPENEYILYDAGNHMEVAYPDVHPSEWKWADTADNYNKIFYNNSGLDALQRSVENYVHENLTA